MNVANVICGGLLHMNKKNQYADSVKETLILTLAVAIIAAAVYFFLVQPRFCQQYLWSWNHSVKLCTTSIVSNHYDLKCSASDYRILYMRSGIRSKNCLYKHYASTVSGAFRKEFSRIFTP